MPFLSQVKKTLFLMVRMSFLFACMPVCVCTSIFDCAFVCVGMCECVCMVSCVCVLPLFLILLFCWAYFSISPISAQIATNPCAHTDTNRHTPLSPLTTISQRETQALLGTHSCTDTCATGTLENGKRIPVILPGFHTPGQL